MFHRFFIVSIYINALLCFKHVLCFALRVRDVTGEVGGISPVNHASAQCIAGLRVSEVATADGA